MDRRTYEGPMDWEYQDKGPLDASSPFTQVGRGPGSQSAFASPSKFGSRPNLFANTPSKPLPPLPQKSLFSPRIQQSNTAPPFRNPAFTTPRKPFDETVFSEAESSPALTEQSDQPNDDTPDFDRFSDLNMGTITPHKIDKNMRYAKTALSTKKHLSGRGEIFRPPRDYPALRKRKRLNGDRDVASLKYHSSRDDSYSDDDESDTQISGSRSRRTKRKGAQNTGMLASTFDLINRHPNLPDNLKKWVSFLVNVSVVSALGYWAWAIVSTVRGDIMTANSAARRELVARAAACQTQYDINNCQGNDRPALQTMCDEWDECRYLDPESIMVVRNTAKEVAGVFNTFATTMEYRSYILLFGILFLCFGLNFWAGAGGGNHAKVSAPVPPTPAHGHPQPSGFPGPSNQAYMYVPIETPSRRRQIDVDTDATDTDGAPSPVRKSIMPPQTPSRRFTSEKEGRRSPVKVGRSPYKDF
ncbi:Di-sulfide bridge nucleocytoplasmic transport domain-containing protein [Plectosphaerella plurivora]|uniref:Di-sulfide bridge nucleocytoplasmic transport domain-containing protein n=1 Tax=Plectosphaerella plurivora TaxID=936078 RepID=A0A9P8VPI1_9PEZI|nr:Di-sulfide bridge nucleocytoplasmic transport domain-containing protein [Plectosphaerella plurivora]